MKQLPIQSPHYRYILQSFKEWLDVLGYAETTVYGMPHYVKELLHYFEKTGKTQIADINNKDIKEYYRQLKQRTNTRRGGGLSNSYLNKHLQAIQKFSDYLRQSGRLLIPKLYIPQEDDNHQIKSIITQEEIQQLYKAAENYQEEMNSIKRTYLYEVLALRDKAMLTVLYGCGLRRNEAVHLDISDIQAEKKYLYVRKGKNYKERLVPLNAKGLNYLQDYLYDGRPHFVRYEKSSSPSRPSVRDRSGRSGGAEAFFISERGKRIGGQTMLLRLKILIQRTANTELQEKEIGLHTLRHSIATHLLQNGMKLEAIAKFLGHSSLESTQIYTHLLENESALSGRNILAEI